MAVTGAAGGIYKFDAIGSTSGRLWVKYLRYGNATTAGDTAVVTDGQNNELWRTVADGQYFIDLMPIYRWINGIKVPVLSSGIVNVYT